MAFQALELHTSQREDLWRKTGELVAADYSIGSANVCPFPVATEHAHQESLAGKCITLQEQLDTACAQVEVDSKHNMVTYTHTYIHANSIHTQTHF